MPSAAFAQAGHTVSGTITSDKGEALPGVTVIVKGQSWLSILKLRASLGRVGRTAINPYQTQGSLSAGPGAGYYNYGTVGAVG